MTRTRIRFFVSYARNDIKICEKLIELLRTQMAPSVRYEFHLWDDRAIIAGENWHDEILQAIAACDLGLLLISPSFLGSPFIAAEELPAFVGDQAKPAIPVELQTVSPGTHNLKGLQSQQLFRLDRQTPFGKCGDTNRQTRFAEQLYEQIERRLDRLGM